MRPERALLAALLALALAAGCRQDMHDQPRVRPLGESGLWVDGQGARPLPAHTVARGQLREDTLFYTGKLPNGRPTATLPPQLTLSRALLERGRDRYEIFCGPCHDATGGGRGVVVRRGFKQPPSYLVDRLRQMPIGYFYDVTTNGFGNMASYASQIPPADRWAIAAWIRVLQRAGHTPAADLDAAERAALAAVPTPAHAPEPATAPSPH